MLPNVHHGACSSNMQKGVSFKLSRSHGSCQWLGLTPSRTKLNLLFVVEIVSEVPVASHFEIGTSVLSSPCPLFFSTSCLSRSPCWAQAPDVHFLGFDEVVYSRIEMAILYTFHAVGISECILSEWLYQKRLGSNCVDGATGWESGLEPAVLMTFKLQCWFESDSDVFLYNIKKWSRNCLVKTNVT